MKLADLFIKLGLKSDDYKKGIDQAQQKTNAFTAGLKKIGGMIAGVFAIGSIASFTKELVQLGGVADGVRAAFNRIADDKVLEELKRSTAGTVAELELMKRAVQANNLGIPIQNLASLFQFATKRAQDTGESVDYLVNSIVMGIGRKSPLILDNLGISAVQLKEKLHGVGMETASVGDIAKAVGEIAAESMAKTGGIIETNAIKTQQLKAAWDDFKLSLAGSETLTNIAETALSSLSKEIERLPESLAISGNALRWFFRMGYKSKVEQEALDDITENLRTFGGKKEQQQPTKEIDNSINKIDELNVYSKKYANTLNGLKERINALTEAKKDLDLSDVSELSRINQKIKSLEALIKKYDELGTKTAVQRIGNMAPMTGQKGTPKIGDTTVPMPEGLRDMIGLAKNAEMTKKYTAEMLADWTNFTTDLGHLVNDGIVNFIDEFAYSLGQLASGNINLKGFFNNILNQLSQFLGQIGKLMIAFGVAQLAFGESLKNIFNPASAPILIAAGAALVAISGAIGGMASKAAGGGCAATGASGGLNIKTVDKYDQQQELVARVSGRDLEFVMQQRSNFKNKL